MATYAIMDEKGNVINRIVADQDFIDEKYPGAVLIPEPVIAEVKETQQAIVLNEKQIAVLTAAGLL